MISLTTQKRIAFFDFDGTITEKDSLLEIIKYINGVPSFYLGFALLSPWLIAMKLKLISNSKTKERAFRYFFGGLTSEAFQIKCEQFAIEIIPTLVRKKALHEIRKHIEQGTEVVVVSASPENFVSPWCKANQLQCIATRLEIKGNKITGNIHGENCYGQEKVNRIKEGYDLSQYDNIYGYGDSNGDKEMLSISTLRFFKPFRS